MLFIKCRLVQSELLPIVAFIINNCLNQRNVQFEVIPMNESNLPNDVVFTVYAFIFVWRMIAKFEKHSLWVFFNNSNPFLPQKSYFNFKKVLKLTQVFLNSL